MAGETLYRCAICGIESSHPLHWFMIQCSVNEVKIKKWEMAAADTEGVRHYCGEAHASVYVSRWFESSCSPALPDFNRATSG